MGLQHTLMQLVGIIGISLFLAACSNTPVQEPDLPEKKYYEDAQKAFEEGRPALAVQHLTDLDIRYPFGEYSEQAKLELIYAHFLAGDYVSSHSAANRFIKNHPDHDLLDYAFYYRALSTYKSAENLSFRYLDQKLSERDTNEFVKAFNEFAELLQRYPNSAYNVDTKARMIFLRNTIAEHEIKVAHYYFKRQAPLAALKRGQTVIRDYASSNSIENALVVIVHAYQMLGEATLAEKNLNILKQNYPNSKHLNKQGKFIAPEIPADAKPSFWYWVTLGLID